MKTARMFLAFDLDDEVVDRLVAVIGKLKPVCGDARWCKRDALHMTVKFFGTLPLDWAGNIGRIVSRTIAAHGPLSCETRGIGGFPDVLGPRVLWAGAGEGADEVSRIVDELLLALECEGFSGDDRKFVPHVTLARISRRERLDVARLEKALPGFAARPFGVNEFDHLTLYASELTREGPLYTVIDRWEFSGATE